MVSAAAELDEVEAVVFQDGTYLASFFGLEATFLELDAVELDAEAEVGSCPSLDLFADFDEDPRAIFQGATVFVCPSVRCGGDELGKEVAVGCNRALEMSFESHGWLANQHAVESRHTQPSQDTQQHAPTHQSVRRSPPVTQHAASRTSFQ